MADLSIMKESIGPFFIEGADSILHEHYDRTDTKIDIPPVNYNWLHYKAVEDTGMLLCLGAREEGKMLGFAMYYVMKHPHHVDALWAACDGLCVSVDGRGKGVGRKLLEFAEQEFRQMGVTRMIQMGRSWYKGETLYEKMGFTMTEQVFYKDLTGNYPLATWEKMGKLARGEYDEPVSPETPSLDW